MKQRLGNTWAGRVLWLAVVCGLLFPTAWAWAQGGTEGTSTVTLSERALLLQGLVGQALQRTFIVSVQGASIHGVSLSMSDLVDAASGAAILGGDVTLEPSTVDELQDRQRFSVTVSGSNVRAGSYAGELSIWYDELTASQPLTIAVRALFEVVPSVDVDVSSKNRTLAITTGGAIPYVGRPTGDGPALGELPIYLVQKTLGDAEVEEAQILTMSGPAGQALPDGVMQIQTTMPFTLTDQDAAALRVVVSGRNLPAGDYSGSMLVRVRNQAAPIEVPVALQVKHGPLWPVAILALSVLVGVFIAFYNTRGLANAAWMRRIKALDRRITQGSDGLQNNEKAQAADLLEQAVDALLDGESKETIDARLDAVDRYLQETRTTAQALLDEIAQAEQRADALSICKGSAGALARDLGQARHNIDMGGYKSISEARGKVADKIEQVSTLEKLEPELKQRLAELDDERRADVEAQLGKASSLTEIEQTLASMATPLAQPKGVILEADRLTGAARGNFSYALNILSAEKPERDVQAAQAETRRAWNRFELKTRLAGVLGGAIVYIFTLLVGWATIYEASPTFGAKPEDYVTLILWGAAANVIGGQAINLSSIWQKQRKEPEPQPKPEEG
jgi:hypothetical protein